MRALINNFLTFTMKKINKKTIMTKTMKSLRNVRTNFMSIHVTVFSLGYFYSCVQLKEKYEALLADKEKELNLAIAR